jgi:signal transduction histidine kinase
LKFTPANGRVVIDSRVENGEALVWVTDTGPGIPPDDLPHIFDRFWHARRGGARQGNGLGLSIAQGIMRAQNGRIWVESEVGKGTTFYMSLPLARTERAMPELSLSGFRAASSPV